MKHPFRKIVLPILAFLAGGAILFYFMLPAINLRSAEFWGWLFLSLLCGGLTFFYLNRNHLTEIFGNFSLFTHVAVAKQTPSGRKVMATEWKVNFTKRAKTVLIVIVAVAVVLLGAIFFSSSRVTRAKDYQEMLTVTEADFAEDIAEMPISQIPIVDRDTASRLGNRKIGEVVELVSQFNVSEYYTQINYKTKPYRVSPLEYAGFLKWLANTDEGIPYYISIDMATQETDLVELSEGMRYSPSEYFTRDLTRHIRFAHPTKMFEELSFEVDDNGHPFWVMSYYDYTFGLFGGRDIQGIILVDAVSGKMTEYRVGEVPSWIDRVYDSELVVEQANNWGSLKNGFWNSVFAQKNCVVTTDGYNYIAVNDDVWLYTGITSVSADESNIGFILINMRTKEAKTYMINGAEEYSAMESAEGQIQEKGYTATFPILINVEDTPSYFISLKDKAGTVKAYAFVSVAEYYIVGVADTIGGAMNEYLRLLGGSSSGGPDAGDTHTVTVTVSEVTTAVRDGNSVYYIKAEDGTVYTATITVSDLLPFVKAGDTLTFVCDEKNQIVSIGEN